MMLHASSQSWVHVATKLQNAWHFWRSTETTFNSRQWAHGVIKCVAENGSDDQKYAY